jgi:hypothetical protein
MMIIIKALKNKESVAVPLLDEIERGRNTAASRINYRF